MSLPKIAPFLLVLAWLWPGHYYPWFSAEQDAIAILSLVLLAMAMLVRTARVRLIAATKPRKADPGCPTCRQSCPSLASASASFTG